MTLGEVPNDGRKSVWLGDAAPQQRPAPRRTRGERTRQRLLRAGRRLFADGGYLTCTVEEIAAAAEISRAAFYLHYRSKRALLADILDREFGWQVRRYRGLQLSSPPREADFAVWIESFIRGYAEGRDSLSLFLFAGAIDPANRELSASKRDAFARLLGERQPAFRVRSPDGSWNEGRLIELNLLLNQLDQLCSQAAVGAWPHDEALSVRILSRQFLRFLES